MIFSKLGEMGRLGNQLWQVAGAAGIAMKFEQQLYLPEDWEYRAVFSVPDETFGPQHGEEAWSYAEHLHPRARPYLQDIRLWEDLAGEIQRWFEPSDYAERWLSRYPFFLAANQKIALHVRRGDNAARENGDDYFPLPTIEYYQEALSRVPKEPVFVFSDDLEWCQENLSDRLDAELYFPDFGGNIRPETVPGTRNPTPVMDWVDLLMMARCDYHIIANSSYSWWGAYLSTNPNPIYPKRWYGKAMDFTDPTLMFPEEWIGI